MKRRKAGRIGVADCLRLTLVGHLQQFEPQAPAPLVKAEVALLWPIGEGVMRQNASALNRDEKKPAKFGASQEEGGVFGGHSSPLRLRSTSSPMLGVA